MHLRHWVVTVPFCRQFSYWPEALWLKHCDVIVPKANLTQRRNDATHKWLFVAPLRRCVKPFVAVLVLICVNFQGAMPNRELPVFCPAQLTIGKKGLYYAVIFLADFLTYVLKEEHIMPSATAIPRDDAGKLAFLQHLNVTLPLYAAILSVTADELAKLATGTAWFAYIMEVQQLATHFSDAIIANKRILRDGPAERALTVPTFPTFPVPPDTPPFADIFGFVGLQIRRIKLHAAYTESIGKALSIIPSHGSGTDPDTAQPVLAVEFRGGHPYLLFSLNGMDSVEVEVDRGDGHFALLTIDTTPNHLDEHPLPAAGTVALWRYRAIYRQRDVRVGHWSQVLDVSVMGG